jgi:hypothetical protein
MQVLRALMTVAAVAAGLWAQSADKPLTNGEIESMLVAGLPENTILLKIGAAAVRGLVDLEASSTGLIALKQKGASEKVLNAVIWAEPFGAALKRLLDEDRAAPGLPRSSGVYYRAPSGWITMRSLMFWLPFYSASNFLSGRRHDYNVPLGGSHADLQTAERQPAFYLREPASRAWRLVRLASRDDKRLLRFVAGGFARVDRFAANEMREIQISHVAGEVFMLRPAAPLDSGEYALCSSVPGAANLNVCYSFSIPR